MLRDLENTSVSTVFGFLGGLFFGLFLRRGRGPLTSQTTPDVYFEKTPITSHVNNWGPSMMPRLRHSRFPRVLLGLDEE